MSMFKTAKTIEAKPAAKKNNKAEVQMKGLEQLAEIDALVKSLSGIYKSLESKVKSAAFDHFYSFVGDSRPASFRGVEGIASASLEMRKRSTASALSEAEQALLAQHNLPTEKSIATNKMFGINPIYAENDALLAKVEAALAGIVPDDFIVLQEEKSKVVVTDETIELAFRSKTTPAEVIQAITVLAIKPKLEVTDINKILADVKALIAD